MNVICDMLNLRQIEAFRAVMIAGTVTGASRALNISQPAVSRLIRDLEKDVEIRLFDRKKGRVVPTLEANAFYQEVELSFIGLRNLEDFAREIRDSGLEKLAVGAMPALCLDLVPDVIRSYLSTRPGVKIALEARSSESIVERTAGLRFDLGLADPRFERDGITLLFEVSASCLALVPHDHRLAEKHRITASDLDGEPFIALSLPLSTRQTLDRVFEDAGVRPDIRIETPLSYVVSNMVKHGLGVSVIDPFTGYHLSDHRVVLRPFRPDVTFRFGVIAPAGRSLTQLGRDFIDALIGGLNRHTVEYGSDIRIQLHDRSLGDAIAKFTALDPMLASPPHRRR